MQDHRVFFCLCPKFSIHRCFRSLPQKLDGGGGRTQVHRLPFLSIRLIMPMLHVCAYPGCGKAVAYSAHYCPEHQKKIDALRAQRYGKHATTENATARGYTGKWRRAAKEFLRANPLCAECLRRGITRAATDVDHIIPWNNLGQRDMRLFWDRSNWQALCHECQRGER